MHSRPWPRASAGSVTTTHSNTIAAAAAAIEEARIQSLCAHLLFHRAARDAEREHALVFRDAWVRDAPSRFNSSVLSVASTAAVQEPGIKPTGSHLVLHGGPWDTCSEHPLELCNAW